MLTINNFLEDKRSLKEIKCLETLYGHQAPFALYVHLARFLSASLKSFNMR